MASCSSGLISQVVSHRDGLISHVVSLMGGLLSQVVSRRSGLISQVVSHRGGLISQMVSCRGGLISQVVSHLLLLVFRHSLFALNQISILQSSWFILSYKSWMFGDEYIHVVSSAKHIISKDVVL